MRKTLLSVGTNLSLLGIRNTVFVAAGYSVIPAKSCAEAEKAIHSRRLSAVIVGHSLSKNLRERIVATAKERQLPIVVLHANAYEAPVALADANLCGIDGAAQITQVLTDLLAEAH